MHTRKKKKNEKRKKRRTKRERTGERTRFFFFEIMENEANMRSGRRPGPEVRVAGGWYDQSSYDIAS